MKHYGHLEGKIKKFYLNEGLKIEIEPHGSRGPDIIGKDSEGKVFIGEIKNEKEIDRDLKGYWSQWNSDTSFGGKTKEYKLKSNYTDKGEGLNSSQNKGWASVIDGQLRGYCCKYNRDKGDLVVENYNKYSKNLHETLNYLEEQSRIVKYNVKKSNNGIGIIRIFFNNSREESMSLMLNTKIPALVLQIIPWKKIPWKKVLDHIPLIEERIRKWAELKKNKEDSKLELRLESVNETVVDLVKQNHELTKIVKLVNLRLWWVVILFGAFIIYYITINII